MRLVEVSAQKRDRRPVHGRAALHGPDHVLEAEDPAEQLRREADLPLEHPLQPPLVDREAAGQRPHPFPAARRCDGGDRRFDGIAAGAQPLQQHAFDFAEPFVGGRLQVSVAAVLLEHFVSPSPSPHSPTR